MNSFKRVRAFQIELEFGSVGFWGEGKPEYPEKNLSEQRGEPTTNSTHIWRQRRDLNPGHIGGRWALPLLLHPCSPTYLFWAWKRNSFRAGPPYRHYGEFSLGPLIHLSFRPLLFSTCVTNFSSIRNLLTGQVDCTTSLAILYPNFLCKKRKKKLKVDSLCLCSVEKEKTTRRK